MQGLRKNARNFKNTVMKKYDNNQVTFKEKIFFLVFTTILTLFCLYKALFELHYENLIWLVNILLWYFLFIRKIWVDEGSRKIISGFGNMKFGRISYEIDKITSIRIVRSRKGKYRNLEIRSGQNRFYQLAPRDFEGFINEVTSLNNSIEILTHSTWDVPHLA
jgi:hypothetical protein